MRKLKFISLVFLGIIFLSGCQRSVKDSKVVGSGHDTVSQRSVKDSNVVGSGLEIPNLITHHTVSNRSVKASNVVGSWHRAIKTYNRGYHFSLSSRLEIIKSSTGSFDYELQETKIDWRYDQTTTTYSGKLDKSVEDGNWNFMTGKLWQEGGRIIVPENGWNDGKPLSLTLWFAADGDTMTFH